jgi:pimeloyl-ACP methyl ester carboxylesterase
LSATIGTVLSWSVGLAIEGQRFRAIAIDTSKLERFDCQQAGFTGKEPWQGVCGWLTVPEDHFDPTNRNTIKLAVAVVRSPAKNPAADPIVYLEGGPGAAAVANTNILTTELFAADVAQRDIVMIDQRGVGRSQPRLNCPEVSSFALTGLDQPRSDAAYMQSYLAALRGCVDRLQRQGVNLAAYTSAQSAADVVAVSQALGYRQINLYGLSYGSRLALTLIRDAGKSGYIRSAAIGGVYGPEANALEFPIILLERLEILFDTCAEAAACNAAYPDLRTRTFALLARLNAQPVSIEVPIGRGEATRRTIANANTLLMGLFGALLNTGSIEQIPAKLAAAMQGDTTLLVEGVQWQIWQLLLFDWGMNTAVQCQEEFLLVTPVQRSAVMANIPPIATGFTLRFPESSPLLIDFCRQLGFQPRPSLENEPVGSDVPLLVISGRYDPFTPPTWADRATAGFQNRYIYTLPAAGHDSASAGTCPKSIVSAFFATPTQTPDTRCLEQIQQPEFEINPPR